jgi:DNA topoisomerase-2
MAEKKRGFKQKSQLEHCKIRPGMYIGSVKPDTIPMYVLEEDKFTMREIKFTTGLLKIFDEVLVNATDHYTNYPKLVKNIDIKFNIETGEILVRNNGPGIPVDMVETLNDGTMYRPQAIFTQFITGDNFDEDDNIEQERIVGGMNGLGSKLAAAYSDLFQIETYDENTGILYKQGFIDRLNIIDTPIIKHRLNFYQIIRPLVIRNTPSLLVKIYISLLKLECTTLQCLLVLDAMFHFRTNQ